MTMPGSESVLGFILSSSKGSTMPLIWSFALLTSLLAGAQAMTAAEAAAIAGSYAANINVHAIP